ncbi:TPA: capsule biosynthesis protein CapG [Streptococcus pneumoniae]|uniref:Capsular polysaccharide phosphotransferase WcwK n=2 Tax=Streptococcus pneumoniae TaxID=1313 RepID=WCWK5_STREE|nr:RecName: Full=Capsular polysaccharide phosphotransferase WcwK; AltName: Full=Stealth protein WcwK [Streptococcus pneumoniae]CAI32887.1 putative glycosyl transferase [Streptococcus pneumoniae]HEU3554684.1 capsule biosynthesis protein CapG [Streptococcus pneumoniae]HEU3638166.1 capsule biosynthesis protein CapG [Streptococcus pneumoniae]HEU3644444.1 capsule biosynthesis protein CapG [Streptococcus pneumoniae]HEU3652384.1 capsule biosynthesis protein CapG [Streptococcus pneumoniae]
MKNMEQIDFVVTWVNDKDVDWCKRKSEFEKEYNIFQDLNSEERYREWGLMKYWFRAVEKYAPWVNKIYFITEGHVPNWLDVNHPKLVHVKHEDYIEKQFLPTFNSNVIEMNLIHLKDLSEKFVLFNDDFFINDFVKQSDFFENNLPKDTGIFSPLIPRENSLTPIILNNMEIINKYFSKKKILEQNFSKFFNIKYGKHLLKNICLLPWSDLLGFYDNHIPVSYCKSNFLEVYEKEHAIFNLTFKNKFRNKNEINHWLIRYWQLSSGNFIPRNINFGKNYAISNDPTDIINELKLSKYKIICINDGESIDNFDAVKGLMINAFEKKFPEKSSFEKK